MLTLAAGLGGMFAGVPNWWAAFVVGYGFVLPAVAMLERDESAETTSSATSGTQSAGSSSTDLGDDEASRTDAMETLRERYARGELSEAQFERKLERLLETETLENARDTVERPGSVDDDAGGANRRSTGRDAEVERN